MPCLFSCPGKAFWELERLISIAKSLAESPSSTHVWGAACLGRVEDSFPDTCKKKASLLGLSGQHHFF